MTSHLEEGILHELLDGEIPSSDLPPIQAHLAGCAECRARLEEAREFQSASDGLLEVLDQSEALASARRRPAIGRRGAPWIRNLAWAATIVIAVGAGYYGRGGGTFFARPEVARLPAPAQERATAPVDRPAAASKPLSAPSAPEPLLDADKPAARDGAGAATSVGKSALADRKTGPAELKAGDELSARADSGVGARLAPAPVTPSAESRQLQFRETPPANTPEGMPARRNEAVVSMAKVSAAPDTISFAEAMRRLGGTLHLIGGLIPDRLEAVGPEVRVVYPLATGALYLTQRLLNGRVEYRLTAPAGFPADSLQRLRLRIRE